MCSTKGSTVTNINPAITPIAQFYKVVPVNQSWAAGRLTSRNTVNFDEALTLQLVGDDEDNMVPVTTPSVEIHLIGNTDLVLPWRNWYGEDRKLRWSVISTDVIVDPDGQTWITSSMSKTLPG